jgi:hypothetical protein
MSFQVTAVGTDLHVMDSMAWTTWALKVVGIELGKRSHK